MGTRIIITSLALCWIACTVICNGIVPDVARRYDIEDKVYQTLLDRIGKLEIKVEGHEAAFNRISELEKIVESHPAELEAVKLELRQEMNTLRQSHADGISNLKFKFDADLNTLRNGNELHKATKMANVVSGTQYESQDELGDSTPGMEVTDVWALNQTDHIAERKTGTIIEKNERGMKRIARKSMHLGSIEQKTNRIRRAEGEMVVAFFSTLSVTTSILGLNQNVKFDTVVTNVGNAYDKHTGVFRAPVSGVYVFSTTMVAEGRTAVHFGLYRNSQRLTVLWVRDSDYSYDGISNTIVVHLGQNDNVAVQHLDSDNSIYGSMHCMFSGFLLSQDDQSIIVGK